MNHASERRKGRMPRYPWVLGHLLAMGCGLALFAFGGCGGPSWPSNGKLPDPVVDKLTDCGKKGPISTKSVKYDLAFLVHVTEDDREARVDDVMLADSTLHLYEVEACMRDALYAMRTPIEALALRRREPLWDPGVTADTRTLLAQAQVISLLEAIAVIAVGYVIYTVVVQVVVDSRRPKRRPPPAVPDEPATPEATGTPTATSVPIGTAAPTVTGVDVDCKKAKEECIEECSETSLPTPDFGVKFRRCMRACMGAKGCVY